MIYSYVLKNDGGYAPNVKGGICTLATCKPKIRKHANVGDWIIGFGSKRTGYQNKIVYMMKVSKKLTFKEYNELCLKKYPIKIPKKRTDIGDCQYYYKNGELIQRPGCHTYDNIKIDISGEYVLIADQFYFFGTKAIETPIELKPIIKTGVGHKSQSNKPYETVFNNWISNNAPFTIPTDAKHIDYLSSCSKKKQTKLC